MKRRKSEKVKAIERHSCLQQKSPLRAGQPTLRNARTLTQNVNRASAESSETDESENDEYDSDTIGSGGEYDSSDVILAFIRMMPILGQTPNAQGELYLGDRKFTSLSFDLCFSNQLSQCSIGVVNIVLCSIGVVNIVFTVSTMT